MADVTVPATILPIEGGGRFAVRRIYCVGRNYLDHIREMGEADGRDPPFFFQKPTDAIVQDGAIIPYPPATQDFQFEVELVAAIGTGGRNIAVDAAEEHILGYAVGLDMTRRDLQRDAVKKAWPWEMGKSFDQSAPCGAIRPISTTGKVRSGSIRLSVNGAVRQQGDVAHMIWNVAEIISNLSAQYELVPGDIIMTGTPSGVGPVSPGDNLAGEIEGVGKLSVVIGPKGI
jgi:fumarylpyruvate hydrolase